MANIMINTRCNLNCTYCFANDISIHHDMSFANVKKAVDFILKKNSERIGIIGGEPTLHPELREILRYLNLRLDVKEVMIFTNGILIDKYWEELNNSKIKILVNCNSSSMMTDRLYHKMEQNIIDAVGKFDLRERIALGLNIYDPQMDFSFVLDLLKKSEIKNLRLSVVVPNYAVEDTQGCLEYYKSMKDITYKIICEALKNGVLPHFDCNVMPKCIFSLEEKRSILNLSKGRISNILSEMTYCTPAIDILPDLTAVRCLGISESERVFIDMFETIGDLRNYFSYKYDDFCYILPTSEKCKNCYERIVKKCSGGCISYKKSKIEKFLQN